MSYPYKDDPDGIILSEDGGDEVDFARAAINVITLADIPPVFKQLEGGKRECLPGNRLTLIQSSWGERISDVIDPAYGILALVVTKGHDLNEDTAKKIHASVESTVAPRKSQCLRWAGEAVLIAFRELSYYKTVGDSFVSGKLDSLNITEIKGASFINAPQCFVEILAPPDQGMDVQGALNPVVSSFSGAFSQATILETKEYPSGDQFLTEVLDGGVPSLVITLMFDVRAQSLAKKAKEALMKLPWKQVTLPGPLQDEIGFDTEFFVHTKLPLPAIALKTGAPTSGVQITRLVQSKENFENVVKTYQSKLEVTPIGGATSASGVMSKKFAISSRSELVVSFLPGVKVIKIDAARLCFQDKSSQGGKAEVETDTEGNQIMIVSSYK